MHIARSIKSAIRLILPSFIQAWLRKRRFLSQRNEILEIWKSNNFPLPPPHAYKQTVIEGYKTKYELNTFIETGTFLGDMVEVQKDNFTKVISIELGSSLYENAVKRFKNDENVEIIYGDSAIVLGQIVEGLPDRALFWLDGHFSEGITAKGIKECPIYEELNAIFKTNGKHIVLIDDARLFIGQNDYPSLNDLFKFIKTKSPASITSVEYDIIRIEYSN